MGWGRHVVCKLSILFADTKNVSHVLDFVLVMVEVPALVNLKRKETDRELEWERMENDNRVWT